MTLDEEITRAEEAHLLMSNPMLSEAFTKVESGLIEAIKKTPIKDRDMQHELALSLQLLGQIQNHLKDVMTTGKMARMQKETLAQKARRILG